MKIKELEKLKDYASLISISWYPSAGWVIKLHKGSYSLIMLSDKSLTRAIRKIFKSLGIKIEEDENENTGNRSR